MKKIGVIVGRFQTPDLHQGHIALFDYVRRRSDFIILAVGVSESIGTRRDPLDFLSRELMLKKFLYDTIMSDYTVIEPIFDKESDRVWSNNLDNVIRKYKKESHCSVTIYGGRDSFIPHYFGRFKTEFVSLDIPVSSSDIRRTLLVSNTQEFRKGAIYAAQRSYPRVFMTVDIAVTRPNLAGGLKVLLGQKKDSEELRFPGGFVDPKDRSLAYAAARELQEEVPGVDVGGMDNMSLISSRLVDDWRYRGTGDGIMTSFFQANYIFGNLQAGDDLAKVGWYPIHKSTQDRICKTHKPLYGDLVEYSYSRMEELCLSQ